MDFEDGAQAVDHDSAAHLEVATDVVAEALDTAIAAALGVASDGPSEPFADMEPDAALLGTAAAGDGFLMENIHTAMAPAQTPAHAPAALQRSESPLTVALEARDLQGGELAGLAILYENEVLKFAHCDAQRGAQPDVQDVQPNAEAHADKSAAGQPVEPMLLTFMANASDEAVPVTLRVPLSPSPSPVHAESREESPAVPAAPSPKEREEEIDQGIDEGIRQEDVAKHTQAPQPAPSRPPPTVPLAPTPPTPPAPAPIKPSISPPGPPSLPLVVTVAAEPVPFALALTIVAPSPVDASEEAAYREAMVEYDAALAEHERQTSDYEVALGQYEAELTAYGAQKTDYDELLLPAYEADLRAHKAEISRYEAQQHVRPRKKAPSVDPAEAARAYEMAVREREIREIEVQTDLTTLDMDMDAPAPPIPPTPYPYTLRLDIQLSPSLKPDGAPSPLQLRADDESSSIASAPASTPAVGPYIPYPLPYPGVDNALIDDELLDLEDDPFPQPRPGMPRLAALDAPTPPPDFEEAVPLHHKQHWKKLRNGKLQKKPQAERNHWKKLRGTASLPALKQHPRQQAPPNEPPWLVDEYDESAPVGAEVGGAPGGAMGAGRQAVPRSLMRAVHSVRTLEALRKDSRRRRPSRELPGEAEVSIEEGEADESQQGLSESYTSSIAPLDRPSTVHTAYQGMHHVSAYSMWVVKPKVCAQAYAGLARALSPPP